MELRVKRSLDTRLALICLVLVALLLRFTGIDYGLPLQLHPDECSQVETALKMQSGDLNPHFFRYPTLFTYQLFVMDGAVSLFSAVSGWSAYLPSYYLLGRILSAAFGALTIGAIYWLARIAVNKTAGLISAFLLAISPELVRESHYATVDIAMTFWCVLALAFAFRAVRQKQLDFVLAAVAVGLALGTKYPAAIMLPPLLGLFRWLVWKRAEPTESWLKTRAIALLSIFLGVVSLGGLALLPLPAILALLKSWTTDGTLKPEYLALFNAVLSLGWTTAGAILSLGLVMWRNERLRRGVNKLAHPSLLAFCVVVIITFVLSSPFVFLDLPHAARDILYEYRHGSLGGIAQYRTDDPIQATLAQPSFFPEPAFYWDWWIGQNGWLMLAAALTGAWVLAKKNTPALFTTGFIVVALALVLTRAANKGERYALLLVPLLILLISAGVSSLIESQALRARRTLYPIIVFLVAGVSLISTWNILYREFILPDTRVLAARWIQQNIPPGDLIVREFNTPDLEHASSQFKVIGLVSAFETKSIEDWQSMGVKVFLIGPIRDWYKQNAAIYPRAAENYSALEHQASLVHKFEASNQSSGPTIWIYRLP